MKKLIILLAVLLIGSASIFAADIQLGVSGPSFFFYDGAVVALDCRTHNYFDEKNRYGFEMAHSFTPFTMENHFGDFEFLYSLFLGPCITMPMGRHVKFTAATGFKYIFDINRVVDKDFYSDQNPDEKILQIDKHFYNGFAWALDFQFKFLADKEYSVVLGLPFAVGKGKPHYWQTFKSDNPDSHYKTLKSDLFYESFIDFETFYLMFCWNL